MVKGLRTLLTGLFISLCIVLGSFSHSAFAASEARAVHNGPMLLVSSTDVHGRLRFPSDIHNKQPIKRRNADDLGM